MLDLPPAFSGPEAVDKALPSFEKRPPVFGRGGFAWAALNCAYWPVPRHRLRPPHQAEGAAPPIVVVGTTRDPATPVPLGRVPGRPALLRHPPHLRGDGHTAYGRGSDCIDTAINTYLLEGTPPPASGKKCR
ncbi:hypothetical protein GTV15_20585 [Streptomyces sp. SID7803]|nr:hypothetical protein [Streptomyces sp. SID7803]